MTAYIDKACMAKANAVLACIEGNLGSCEDLTGPILLEAYSNGRENGYYLHYAGHGGPIEEVTDKAVCFCEDRKSDCIVVYFGSSRDFAMGGRIPSDEVYDGRVYFSHNEYEAAAEFILNYFAD